MQTIQIDGTYTYAENIKYLKIGDQIKLIPNPSNRMNKEAIGAYTLSGKKIGYVPFKSNQLDLKAKYIVGKIQLSQNNPLLLLTMEWPNTNTIHCEPSCITNKKTLQAQCIDVPEPLVPELKNFTKFLQKSGYNIMSIGITELSDSYITLCIRNSESTSFFHLVTKSFYEENIFKYDEFYKFGLMGKCIYIPWQTHRLEKYLEFNYKPSTIAFSGKKFSWANLINSGVFDQMDLINLSGPNCGLNQIQSADLVLFNKKTLSQIPKADRANWVRLVIQYNVKPIEYYNPDNLISNTNNILSQLELNNFTNMFACLEPGGLAYNHKLKAYCPIDLLDPINIVEITLEETITQTDIIKLIGKLVIADKQIINFYNPVTGTIWQIEITDRVKSNFANLLKKSK